MGRIIPGVLAAGALLLAVTLATTFAGSEGPDLMADEERSDIVEPDRAAVVDVALPKSAAPDGVRALRLTVEPLRVVQGETIVLRLFDDAQVGGDPIGSVGFFPPPQPGKPVDYLITLDDRALALTGRLRVELATLDDGKPGDFAIRIVEAELR